MGVINVGGAEDDPEVILANAQAKALIYEARAKMHPAAQVMYVILDRVGAILGGLGCMFVVLVFILLIFGVDLLAFFR